MGGSAPKADPNIGIAAKKSAETGQMMLDWMKDQAKVTNQWAIDDRNRSKTVFEPLQDQFIADANSFASPERKLVAQDQAAADMGLAQQQAQGAADRKAMSMGINPLSGRAGADASRMATDAAMATAGARNLAGRQVEDQGRSLKANAINMGAGLAVNPATSMGISNGAVSSGGSAAMQGYSQQGNLLNTQFQQRMQAYQQSQGALGGLGSALGTVAGLLIPSSKEIKHDKVPVTGALGAIRDMPVEAWTYNEGEGDGGRHVGPYAEDFAKATGIGTGKSIDVISMLGVTLGAIQELDKKVDGLAGGKGSAKPKRAMPPMPPDGMGAIPRQSDAMVTQ